MHLGPGERADQASSWVLLRGSLRTTGRAFSVPAAASGAPRLAGGGPLGGLALHVSHWKGQRLAAAAATGSEQRYLLQHLPPVRACVPTGSCFHHDKRIVVQGGTYQNCTHFVDSVMSGIVQHGKGALIQVGHQKDASICLAGMASAQTSEGTAAGSGSGGAPQQQQRPPGQPALPSSPLPHASQNAVWADCGNV